jgi:hypothetical protein
MITFVCYTHSDYKDIWPLVFGQIKKYVNIPKVLFVNKNEETIDNIFDKIIYYDDALTYPCKLMFLCENIDTKYISLVHDNDVVMNFDNDLCYQYVNDMDKNSIDRLMFGVIKRRYSFESYFTKALKGCTSRFMTPYDVGPSIWKLDSLKEIMSHYKDKSYREIEESSIQDYCDKNYNMYGLVSYNNSLYSLGRPFSGYHSFCHILCRGKWLESHIYMDYSYILPQLLKEYNIDINNRGLLLHQDHINVNYRDV